MGKQNVFKKVGFYVKDFFKHWNTPPKEGYYLSNKEFVAYTVGGMGVQGFGVLTQYFAINVGIYLSYAFNFDQDVVFWTGIGAAILSLLRAPIMGWLIDNTNTKFGKYKPYILYTGLLSVVCFWLLAFIPDLFMPNDGVHTDTSKWVVVAVYQVLYFIAFTAFSLYSFGRTGLAQVITSNTNERTKLYSVGGVIDSLGPSIVALIFPLIASAVYGQKGLVYGKTYGDMTAEEVKAVVKPNFWFGMENINTYKVIYPIVGVICVALSLFMFFGTKERIIPEKKVKKKVKFVHGLKECFRNKYFLIGNVSNVLAFGRLMIFAATGYVCAHLMEPQIGETMRGIAPTLTSIGFVPGMLFSPIIQKKLGKKKMIFVSFIGSSAIAALLLVLSLFAFTSPITPWLFFVGLFLHNIFAALWTVVSPAIAADYCEYQQWKTGERLDASMSQYSTIFTTVSGMFTGYLVKELIIKAGAEKASDYANLGVLRNVFIIWSVFSVLCGALALIPYFFWDLTEEKQLAMTRDIRIRCLNEKIDDKALEQDDFKEAIELGVLSEEQAIQLGFEVKKAEDNVEAMKTVQLSTEELTNDEVTTDEDKTDD